MFEWIKSLFSKFIKAFKSFIKEAIPIASQIVVGQLKEIAILAVEDLAKTNFTNEEKRNAAFERIKQYSITHGIQARDSLINALIELAVMRLKNL